jgi:hypothetical protein
MATSSAVTVTEGCFPRLSSGLRTRPACHRRWDPQYERVAKERLGLYDALEAVSVYFEERWHARAARR